jgi:hypothetical protein
MARISIDIDTETRGDVTQSGGHKLFGQPPLLARKKLGILSSITLFDAAAFASSLVTEVEKGFNASPGTVPKRDKQDQVSKANLKSKRDELLNNEGCQIIATIGGMFVNTGISDKANPIPVPFVSLVGSIPDTVDSKCCGGVSLESWTSNKPRVGFLTSKGLSNNNDFCLYHDDGTNSQGAPATTGVPFLEADNWKNGLALTKIQNCSGAGNIDNDLNGMGSQAAAAKGLVIGASPFLLENRNELVTAANKWLSSTPANTTRYVVYPLQIYDEGSRPAIANFSNPQTNAQGKNILFGPDLRKACRLLGYFAGLANDYETGWFQAIPNITVEK